MARRHELLALVAIPPFLLVGGDSADGTASWPWPQAALPVYRLYGEPPRLGLLNHKRGHTVPQMSSRGCSNGSRPTSDRLTPAYLIAPQSLCQGPAS